MIDERAGQGIAQFMTMAEYAEETVWHLLPLRAR
jgi:hypothetical protein